MYTTHTTRVLSKHGSGTGRCFRSRQSSSDAGGGNLPRISMRGGGIGWKFFPLLPGTADQHGAILVALLDGSSPYRLHYPVVAAPQLTSSGNQDLPHSVAARETSGSPSSQWNHCPQASTGSPRPSGCC